MNITIEQVVEIVSSQQGIDKKELANRLAFYQQKNHNAAYSAIQAACQQGLLRVATHIDGRGRETNRMHTIQGGVDSQIIPLLKQQPHGQGLTGNQLTQAILPGHQGHDVERAANRLAKSGQIAKRYAKVSGQKKPVWTYYANGSTPAKKKRKKKVKERRK